MRLYDEAGKGVEGGGNARHDPAAAQGPPIIKGKAYRKGEDGGGGIPQTAGKIQRGQVTKTRAHQCRCPAQARPCRTHHGYAEGGAALKNGGAGQHGCQQEMNPRTCSQCQGRGGHLDLSGALGLLAQLIKFGADDFFGCHACFLLPAARDGPGRARLWPPLYSKNWKIFVEGEERKTGPNGGRRKLGLVFSGEIEYNIN